MVTPAGICPCASATGSGRQLFVPSPFDGSPQLYTQPLSASTAARPEPAAIETGFTPAGICPWFTFTGVADSCGLKPPMPSWPEEFMPQA